MENNPLYDKYGRALEKGDTIFKEGDPGDEMYIIQEGSVEIVKNLGGRNQVLATLEKGDFFGEMAIVNRIRRTATARAGSGLKLLAFDRNGFQQMIEKNPKIALNIIDKLCRRLESTTSQLSLVSASRQKENLRLSLRALFRDQGNGLELKTLLEGLGLSLQIPQVVLGEEINKLVQQEVLAVKDDKVSLLKPEALDGPLGDPGTC